MKKLFILGVAALLSSCSFHSTLGTIESVAIEAEEKNWEELGTEDNCIWYAIPKFEWEVEFCYGEDNLIDQINYFVPKNQGLQFYLYLDYYVGKCTDDVCKNKEYTYTFYEGEDVFVITQKINY